MRNCNYIPYQATAATAAPGGKIHSHCPGTYSNLNMFIISGNKTFYVINDKGLTKIEFQIVKSCWLSTSNWLYSVHVHVYSDSNCNEDGQLLEFDNDCKTTSKILESLAD